MIEDMRIRGMGDKAQQAHIRAIKDFAGFLKRSPDTATPDELRAYQLHMTNAHLQCPYRRAELAFRHHLRPRVYEAAYAVPSSAAEVARGLQRWRGFRPSDGGPGAGPQISRGTRYQRAQADHGGPEIEPADRQRPAGPLFLKITRNRNIVAKGHNLVARLRIPPGIIMPDGPFGRVGARHSVLQK
jgi:integrase-like protein